MGNGLLSCIIQPPRRITWQQVHTKNKSRLPGPRGPISCSRYLLSSLQKCSLVLWVLGVGTDTRVQSSAIITRSNLSRYYTRHCHNSGRRSDIRITRNIPYLALTGELWGVYCEDFCENWPRYNGNAFYIVYVFWWYFLWSCNTGTPGTTFQLAAKCCLSRSGVEPRGLTQWQQLQWYRFWHQMYIILFLRLYQSFALVLT